MAPRTDNLHMNTKNRQRTATFPLALIIALLALALLGPASALAKGGGDDPGGGGGGGGGGGARPEVRVAGSCGRGASSTLKLKARDGGIEAEFEVHGRSGSAWRVAFVQERRTVWRGRARTGGTSHSFSVERRLGDYPGPDQVFVRAIGPRGVTCQATATLPG
jgi:hypothetical protein